MRHGHLLQRESRGYPRGQLAIKDWSETHIAEVHAARVAYDRVAYDRAASGA